MAAKKPRVVIIGAGIAGLTAANKLYTNPNSKDLFEICVVEGGNRIGGRINTSELGGDLIELGATWIHGIENSPIHKIAQEIHSLESDQPWENMDGVLDDPLTLAENGYELNPSLVKPISRLFKKLVDFFHGEVSEDGLSKEEKGCLLKVSTTNCAAEKPSLGSFLQQGLDAYWGFGEGEEEFKGYGFWSRKSLEKAVFAIHENMQRIHTAAGDLYTVDYKAESEYRFFPGIEITIAKGYQSIIESIASVLTVGSIQLGKKVTKFEWQPNSPSEMENGHDIRPVKLHFSDGSVFSADHVIVTVSLGVLKAGICENSGMFDPPLPKFKTEAISRLGYGVVNKLFLELSPTHDTESEKIMRFPFLQLAFHNSTSEFSNPEIPWWMRKTSYLCPIYRKSKVLKSWFAGKEALELESLKDEQIIDGVTSTISCFLPNSNSHEMYNGNLNSVGIPNGRELKFSKVLKSNWGNDPLFLGSYSYVAVGSSGDDLDTLALPLPLNTSHESNSSPPLQILFAGEATHRTLYSTTHGAYFSGIREANRLLQHYLINGV
ncbi:hypothetical protein Vadar_020919 [Vaccinium darrowii]|uniref:Uncharacterized protein n=1 Tax=Vaccinium darrowii TaxID=229202 RepID=A0ACB7YF38_9ERIC|nr:hypothetical protein Vadar_020919 [Vaccinium darrowii]